MRRAFLTDADIAWFAPGGGEVAWAQGAFGYHLKPDVVVLINLTETEASFTLPARKLELVADTAAAPPGDFVEKGAPWDRATRVVAPKSLVVFRSASG
jgi:hypothetical protein